VEEKKLLVDVFKFAGFIKFHEVFYHLAWDRLFCHIGNIKKMGWNLVFCQLLVYAYVSILDRQIFFSDTKVSQNRMALETRVKYSF